jgi:hypothetical protein
MVCGAMVCGAMVCGGLAGGYGFGSYGTVKVWTRTVTETGSLSSGKSTSAVEFGGTSTRTVYSPSTRDPWQAVVRAASRVPQVTAAGA